jgi:ribonucleoside-diphosphate reductase beta chain
VWYCFKNRNKAKANDDGALGLETETDGEDMFAKAGIAAE